MGGGACALVVLANSEIFFFWESWVDIDGLGDTIRAGQAGEDGIRVSRDEQALHRLAIIILFELSSHWTREWHV